jgi:hypothetical protein
VKENFRGAGALSPAFLRGKAMSTKKTCATVQTDYSALRVDVHVDDTGVAVYISRGGRTLALGTARHEETSPTRLALMRARASLRAR